jgi:hypothetical protein
MLRLAPALAHAASVALTAATARRLGGAVWAQAVAALSVLVCGVYLAFGTILVTDILEPLTWLFCAYALIGLVRGGDRRWWLAVGATAGIAFLAKYTIAFWLAALGVGLLATPARRTLARRECWFGAALFLLIVLPNLLWQARHGLPFLEIGRVAATGKNVALTPWAFVDAEIRTLNPGTAPIWLAGLAALLAWRRFADLRFLSIAFVLLIAAMIALHGKDYYPVGAYPVLFAAGAVAVEAWIARPILRTALVAEMLAFGLVGAPFALPVLPIGRFLDYQTQLGLVPEQQERSRLGRLPQYYADMFGWRRDGGARLPGAAAAGSRPGRLPRRQLRRGRRRRRVRRTMAPAAGHQRAQQQLPLGSARPRRQRGHPSRREQGGAAQSLRVGGSRRGVRQSLGDAIRDRPHGLDLSQPRAAARRGLVQPQELSLTGTERPP